MVLQDGRTDYIVVVLLEDVPQKDLTEELKVYLRTFTYIDAKEYRNDVEMIRKKIRFALPRIPLKQNQVFIYNGTLINHQLILSPINQQWTKSTFYHLLHHYTRIISILPPIILGSAILVGNLIGNLHMKSHFIENFKGKSMLHFHRTLA